jgi:formamidopyrimidine-DNA glycosylase
MPEGPECKLLADNLNKKLAGSKLTDIQIYGGRYSKHGPPKNMNKLLKELPLTISKIQAKGKFIWYEFENSNLTLWNTLGMTGWYQNKEDKHNNIGLFYEKNKMKKVIYFNDFRNFGTFIIDTKEALEKKLKSFIIDILDTKDNTELFIKLIRKSRKSICESLLNQKIVAGSGNYLRADALYLARINPFFLQKEITDDNLKELFNCLRQLAWYHYDEDKGKKLKIIDNKINFKLIKDRIFFVYSQKTDVAGLPVLKKEINGRTIHYSQSQIDN